MCFSHLGPLGGRLPAVSALLRPTLYILETAVGTRFWGGTAAWGGRRRRRPLDRWFAAALAWDSAPASRVCHQQPLMSLSNDL
jgi:hypothetical protein